jgi:hypothetical protein
MVDPCRPSFHPPAKTNPVVPMVRKEVEVFVLVAVAGVGCRLARLLIEPSPRAVTALLGKGRRRQIGGGPHAGAVVCRLVPRCLSLALSLCQGRRLLPAMDLDADERERGEERIRYKEKSKKERKKIGKRKMNYLHF